MRLSKHSNTKKWILIFGVISALTISTGCSKTSNNQSPVSTRGQSPIPSAVETQKQDQDLTKNLLSEKIVDSGQVYLAGDDAVALMIVKKGTDEKTAKDLATTYAKTLKEKYKNKKVNSHAFIEGKEIAHITL